VTNITMRRKVLAPKFFGGGLLVITLKLVDADGRANGIPGWLVRSPLK
jgi:hypothetical protein